MLTEIRLRNFKAFADQSFPLAPLTIFMGENGAGKSSVIQSLLMLRQSVDGGDWREGGLNLNGKYCSVGAGADLLRQGADDEAIMIALTDDKGASSRYSFEYDPKGDRLRINEPYDEPTALSVGNFTYLTAERVGPRLTNPRVIATAKNRDMGIRGEGALAVLESFRATILETDDYRRRGLKGSLEEIFQSYLAEISPGARIELENYSQVDSIGSTFSFSSSGGIPGLPFRPTNVGFGLSYSLPIIVACLVATPGSTLIVENPEAHLHTRSQRSLCDLFVATAKSGVQVIVETHSRELFHYLRSGARAGRFDPALGVINYLEASDSNGQRVSRCTSMRRLDEGLAAWPENFFEAYGRPSDLIAPV